MRGGYIHNTVLLDPLAEKASSLGQEVNREVAIHVGENVFYGDLLIQKGSRRILVEAEMSSKRIGNDLAKAVALQVYELWLVVPNSRVAQSVRRKLSQTPIVPKNCGLFILLLPQALQRLENFSELNSRPNVKTEKKKNGQTSVGKVNDDG